MSTQRPVASSGPRIAFALIFLVIAAVSVAKVDFRARHGFGDHIAYYRAAQRLLAGADPYAPTGDTYVYLYPPVWALLVTPLTVAGPVAYGLAWAAVLGLSWLAIRALTRRLLARCGLVLEGWAALLPELALARFTLGAWSSGQVTLPLSALALAGLALCARDAGDADARATPGQHLGATLIGLAASIKVYPLFLAVAVQRLAGWRAVSTLAASVTAVSLAPAAFVGGERFVSLVRDGFLGAGMANLDAQRFWSGRCAPVAAAWHALGGEAGRGLKALELAWGVALAGLVWLAGRRVRFGAGGSGPALWLAFAVTSMLLATPMLGENYLSFLLFPAAVAVAVRAGSPAGDPGRRALGLGMAAAAVLLNAHSPLIVGKRLSEQLERCGLSPLGLLAGWAALGVALSLADQRRGDDRHRHQEHPEEPEEDQHPGVTGAVPGVVHGHPVLQGRCPLPA